MAVGDHTEPLRKMDEEALASIEAKVAARLNDTLADEPKEEEDPTPVDEVDEQDVTDEEEEAAEEEADDEEEPAGETDEEEESTPKGDEEDGGDTGLPDSYIRAALHQGWTLEDIKDLAENKPKLAEKTFKKMYDDVNTLSKQFSDIGRAKKHCDRPANEQKPVKKKVEMRTLTKEQLEAKFGTGDPMVEFMLNQQQTMQAMADQLNNKPDEDDLVVREQNLRNKQREVSTQEERVIERQLNAFFQNKDMDIFEAVYGKLSPGQSWEELTPGQERNRLDTISQAESIRLGSELSGNPITPEDALLKAHLLLTDDFKSEMIRKDIIGKVAKRSKSLTFKPSQGKRTDNSDTGKPRSEKELLRKTRERMKKIGL